MNDAANRGSASLYSRDCIRDVFKASQIAHRDTRWVIELEEGILEFCIFSDAAVAIQESNNLSSSFVVEPFA